MEINKLNSLVELYFKKCEELDPNKPFLKWLKPGKSNYNWGDIKERIFKLSYKIKSLINEGDRCLILSENRPEWQIADLAIMSIGAISVPAYTTSTTSDYSHILNHSEARCIIIASHSLALKALPAVVKSSKCKNVIKIDNDKIKKHNKRSSRPMDCKRHYRTTESS